MRRTPEAIVDIIEKYNKKGKKFFIDMGSLSRTEPQPRKIKKGWKFLGRTKSGDCIYVENKIKK